MVNLPQNVEIMRKTLRKSLRKSCVKSCEKFNNQQFGVEKHGFPHTFSSFPTDFYTTKSPLYLSNLFHFYTYVTTTTINNILIKKLLKEV